MIAPADWVLAIRRMTVTELADTLATIHQTYSTELQGVNDVIVDDRQRGLYRKYELHRVNEDGTHRFQVFDPFFVLRYTTDPHAAVALKAYADSCEHDYPALAADLRAALARAEEMPA